MSRRRTKRRAAGQRYGECSPVFELCCSTLEAEGFTAVKLKINIGGGGACCGNFGNKEFDFLGIGPICQQGFTDPGDQSYCYDPDPGFPMLADLVSASLNLNASGNQPSITAFVALRYNQGGIGGRWAEWQYTYIQDAPCIARDGPLPLVSVLPFGWEEINTPPPPPCSVALDLEWTPTPP